MRKKLVFTAILSVFITVIATAQGWTQDFRDKFQADCIRTAKNNIGDSAARYCSCMGEKLEIIYPDQKKAEKLTAEDFKKPELIQMVRECLDMKWPAEEREAFVTNCVKNATKLGEDKAKRYCECMLIKVEAKFAIKDAAKLTAEEFSKPDWQRKVQTCLQ